MNDVPTRRRRGVRRAGLVLVALALVTGIAWTLARTPRHAGAVVAQPEAPKLPSAPGPKTQPPGSDIKLEDLPPGIKLGSRAASVQSRLGTLDALVLAPDEASFFQAISAWTVGEAGAVRFPILLDDGGYVSQQRITRFVRAFKPKHVLRLTPVDPKPLPADNAGRRGLMEQAVARAWGAANFESLPERWKTFKFVPAGVVVTWPTDPAALAAVALAAGRGQPMIFVDPPGGGSTPVGGLMNLAEATGLAKAIDAALAPVALAGGWRYDGLGDELDALTLCLTTPCKILLPETDQRKMLALTDFLGRSIDQPRKRWAFAGQVAGTGPVKDRAAHALYLAMCGMFLPEPGAAWLFDGYDSAEPWVRYDASQAARELAAGNSTSAKLLTTVDDRPAGMGLDEWRRRAAGAPGTSLGVDAGLITVTTSGEPDFFDLKPGQARPADVPWLRRPAMVYFVHSWSANNPDSRDTVGGMWLERGASAYVGSVHEPYLQAFVPTPLLARRLVNFMPIAAAIRADDAEPWKVALIGDPLATFGPALDRRDDRPGCGPLVDVLSAVPKLLESKDYQQAVRCLSLGGRDRDAARLFAALLRDQPDQATPDVALAAISSVCAVGDNQTLVLALIVAQPLFNSATRPDLLELRDIAWHALYPAISTLRPEELQLLSHCHRPQTLLRDTQQLVTTAQRTRSTDPTPADIIARARPFAADAKVRKELDAIRP